MKIDVNKIKEKIKSFTDKDAEKINFHPKRDWIIIISIFVFLNFSLMIFYGYLFTERGIDDFSSSQVLGNPQEISLDKISSQQINTILRKWEEKQKKFDNLILSRPSFDFLK